MIHITSRCYGRLNELLPYGQRHCEHRLRLKQQLTVQALLYQLRLPHPEVDLVLCNGESVTLQHRLCDRDRFHIYPDAEGIDQPSLIRLRPPPYHVPRFVLDVHLAGLARKMRWLGLDCWYQDGAPDPLIIEKALAEQRTILTRDRGLLQQPAVTHGYYVRTLSCEAQLQEVLTRFSLHAWLNPFSRCIRCNGMIESVKRSDVKQKVKPQIYQMFDRFFRCDSCRQIYWQGSHYERMVESLKGWMLL